METRSTQRKRNSYITHMGYIFRALEFGGLCKQGNSATVNQHGPAGRSVCDNFRRYFHFSQQTGTCSYPELDESNP